MKKYLIEQDRFYCRKRLKVQSTKAFVVSKESEYEAIRNEVLSNFQKISRSPKNIRLRKQHTLHLNVVTDFSIFTNSEYVLSFIGDLTHRTLLKKISTININQSAMITHDLTSEVLIAQAALALKAEKASKNKKLIVEGIFPKNEDFSKLIKGIGIVEQIKSIRCHNRNVDNTSVFKAKGKIEAGDSIQSGDRKLTAQENFITHMNDSLNMIGRQLTDGAENKLLEIIGELIGNAEDHSDSIEAHWQFYGFTDKNSKGEVFQQISIFNFGTSISDSIEKSLSKDIVNKRVEPYIKMHINEVPKEILFTVIALQENISSKLDEQPDRGQGFTDLLQFFEEVAHECTNNEDNHVQMSLVSGAVSIYFDGTYLPKVDRDTGRHLIYFNESNSPMKKPDPTYVKKMRDISFPGTIITIKYRLREEDYELRGV